jgi:hypothetical protein
MIKAIIFDYDIAREAKIKKFFMVEYGWGYKNKVKNQKNIIRQPADILKVVKI